MRLDAVGVVDAKENKGWGNLSPLRTLGREWATWSLDLAVATTTGSIGTCRETCQTTDRPRLYHPDESRALDQFELQHTLEMPGMRPRAPACSGGNSRPRPAHILHSKHTWKPSNDESLVLMPGPETRDQRRKGLLSPHLLSSLSLAQYHEDGAQRSLIICT
ncbi:hypothetical protein CISG_06413 [Coccidioides immitis RMSCC 3703]|uniref:Uncharacterized protein n=2 Tax=Coccidioides immitis TaxID=5501 RepID=A0A0J8R1P3_COCIT|nr:hypothetical protein CIRG_09463 [Coccidioides immitis RMSCC 2394]KMU78260.1 hypothetical protein CISG_06413 [Coccidioides immitis RMSCC 3703]